METSSNKNAESPSPIAAETALKGEKEDHDLSPAFPPELEQQIFAIALRDDINMKEPWGLLLVAKRMSEWLIPLIYEIVIIHPGYRWPPIGLPQHKLGRYGRYVRHLLLDSNAQEQVTRYLAHCTNVSNLVLVNASVHWASLPRSSSRVTPSSILNALASLPLKEVSIDPRILSAAPRSTPIFSNVTHLDAAALHNWNVLSLEIPFHFPHLTHLMLMGEDCKNDDMNRVLGYFPKLKVLIVVSYFYANRNVSEDVRYGFKPTDERVVMLRCTVFLHWKKAAQGLESPWSFADDVVARRRRDKSARVQAVV